MLLPSDERTNETAKSRSWKWNRKRNSEISEVYIKYMIFGVYNMLPRTNAFTFAVFVGEMLNVEMIANIEAYMRMRCILTYKHTLNYADYFILCFVVLLLLLLLLCFFTVSITHIHFVCVCVCVRWLMFRCWCYSRFFSLVSFSIACSLVCTFVRYFVDCYIDVSIESETCSKWD